MIGKQMISKCFVFTLFLASTLTFISCSGDDDNADCLPGIASLSDSLLGTYTGNLTLNGTEVVNLSGTASVTESNCKMYTVSFSDNVPSITGVQFIANTNNSTFTYVNSNATVTVTLTEGSLTVSKTSSPVITFNGDK